jgi:hypothetical protein
METAGKTGIMPAASAEQMKGALMHHAMLLVGYDKSASTFIARNCWGTTWGRGGHCTIPLDVLKVIAPLDSQRHQIIAPALTATAEADMQVAAAPGTQPSTNSGMAAKLRDDIRGDLKRDLDDATKRIRDMMKKPGGQQGQ